MHIGKFIDNYLKDNQMSQRQFAKQCNLSNGYISMLINNSNPRTGKPLVPSLTALLSISKGMGITLDKLIGSIDDTEVDISAAQNLSSLENNYNINIIKIAGRDGSYFERKLTDDQLDLIKKMIDQMPDADDL